MTWEQLICLWTGRVVIVCLLLVGMAVFVGCCADVVYRKMRATYAFIDFLRNGGWAKRNTDPEESTHA